MNFGPHKGGVVLSTGAGCVVAKPGGGFVAVEKGAAEECSVFEPDITFTDFGVLRDSATGLCLGWAHDDAPVPEKEVYTALGLRTSDCTDWQSWDSKIFQQFLYMGSS